MKVTCLLGSPRKKGNSSTLAEVFINKAKEMGAETQLFQLNTLDFKGCQGCLSCKTVRADCAVKDDLTPVLDAVRGTDVLVLATPIYYMDVSAQLKAFIDRTYSFVEPDYLTNPNASRLEKGKKMVFIQTMEADEGAFNDIFNKYDMFFKFYGFEESRHIQVGKVGNDDRLEKKPEAFEQVEAAAVEFCG